MWKVLNGPLFLWDHSPWKKCTFLRTGRSPHMNQYLIYIVLYRMTLVHSLIFQILTHKAWQWILKMTPSMSALEMPLSHNKHSCVWCRTSSHTSGKAAVWPGLFRSLAKPLVSLHKSSQSFQTNTGGKKGTAVEPSLLLQKPQTRWNIQTIVKC